jgi:hypothetical protein
LERDRLKTESVSDLTGAYNLLTESPDSSKVLTHEKLSKRREEAIAKQEEAIGEQRECEEEIIKLLNPKEKLREIDRLLNTDYYEATPVGLKILRPTTKEEWLEYSERLRLTNIIISSFSDERR